MLRTTLVVFILLSSALGACPKGCLKCDSTNSSNATATCEICDITRFYYLNNSGGCELKTQSNCAVPALNPDLSICFQCDKDHFLDQLAKKCAMVPSSILKDNCVKYSPSRGCMQCTGDYLVSNGDCNAVSNPVSQCFLYLADGTCGQCKPGFVKNEAGSQCVEFKKVSNCKTHTDYTCAECKLGYQHAFNIKVLQDVNIQRVQQNLLDKESNNLIKNSNIEECIQKKIENCQVYDSYGRCGLCDPLYYPDKLTGKCILSPESAIFMCNLYSSQNKCAECHTGFFISGDKCILRTKTIPHCIQLDPMAEKCVECHKDYYQDSGDCKVRSLSLHIFNCAKVSLTKDICETCSEGFLQRGDKLACFTPIPNCDLHAIPPDNSVTLKCTTCHKDTIPEPASPNTLVCRLRNKPNCRVFTGDHVETCQTCSINFYLSGTDCLPYTKICKKRDPTDDKCLECFSYQYMKLADSSCHNYNVKNCNAYEPNKDECKSCLSWHYIDTDSKDCVLHHLINCKTPNASENKCDKCLTSYRTLSDIECTKTDFFGCANLNATFDQCITCSPGFYLKNPATSTCEPHQLPGCKASGMNVVDANCSDCEDGFYLKVNKCHLYTVTHCKADGLNPTEDQCTSAKCQDGYYLSNVNRCDPILKFNCDTFNNTTGECNACADNSFFKFEGGCYKKMILGCNMFTSSNTPACQTCKAGYYLSSPKCKPFQLTNCKVPNVADGTCTTCEDNFYWDATVNNCLPQDQPGCETYVNMTSKDCNVAKKPYYTTNSGTVAVRLEIAHCIKRVAATDDEQCEICSEGYYPHAAKTSCIKQSTIANCLVYIDNENKCKQCKSMFQTDASTGTACQVITKTNCVESNGITDVCTVCEPAYKQDGSGGCSATTNITLIANCYGNDSTNDSPCGKCQEGFLLIENAGFNLPADPSLEFNADDNDFSARKGYECSASETCFPIKNSLSKCIHLKSKEFALIDVDGKCQECRNPNLHYLTGNTCIARTNLKCGVFHPVGDGCLGCTEGLMYNTSGTINNNCSESVAPDDSSHCQYTARGARGCYLCREGYVKNVSSKSVAPDSKFKCIVAEDNDERRCSNVDDKITSGGRCLTCREGFIYDTDNKLCYKDETCQRNTDGSCQICHEDYKPKDGTRFLCEPKLQKDECKYNLPELLSSTFKTKTVKFQNRCVRCKEPGMIPLNSVSNADGLMTYKCVKMDIPDYKNHVIDSAIYELGLTRFIYYFNPNENDFYSTDFSKVTSPIYNVACLDMRMPNCRKMDFSQLNQPLNERCLECEPYHYLSPDNGNGIQCVQGSLPGCHKYVSQYVCGECQHGYFKNAKNFCTEYQTIDFCEVYDADNYGCVNCSTGYTEFGGQCVESAEKNCQHFMAAENMCLQCNPGFYIKEMWCHPYTIENCQLYSKINDQCLHCQSDYYLNAPTGECLRNNSRGCQVYSKISNNCLVCDHNYFLLEDTHICRPYHSRNCIQFNPVNGDCVLCDEKTFLSTQSNCQSYTLDNCDVFHPHDDMCLKCSYGFFVNYFGTCTRLNLNNCIYSDPRSNRCLVCSAGFYLQSNGMCAPYSVKNCSLYNRNRDQCLDCLPNYYISSGGTCLAYTISMNCQTLNPYRDECSQCLPGHYLTLNKCVKYTITHCAIPKNDADQCVDCMPGFFLMDNLCHPYNMVNCKQFSLTSNSCTSCDEDQYLEDGLCKVNNALFCAKKSTQSNTCLECPKSFYNDSGLCLPRIESNNCMETEPTMDRCKKCYNTHYLAGGRCISYARKNCKTFDTVKDLCDSCESGKFWMSHGVCEPYTVVNCQEFDATKDLCLKCQTGPYYLSFGKCLGSKIVNNCLTYSSTEDKCLKCKQEFYFSSETECRSKPAGIYKCIQYKNQETCIKCEKGFYVVTNSLGKTYCDRSSFLIDVCLNYSGEKKCQECESTHFLVENECILKTEFTCLVWKSPSECQTCSSKFVLKKNSSGKLFCEHSGIENCESATLDSSEKNVCAKCIPGYFPDGYQCVQPQAPITACMRYVKEGECELCQEKYTLSTSKKGCTPNSIYLSPNCNAGQEHSNPVCKLCESGFILNSDGQCDSCGGEGCDVCDPWDTHRCLLCKGGFDHDGHKCTTPTETTEGPTNNKYMEDGHQHSMKHIDRLNCLFLGLLALLTLSRN